MKHRIKITATIERVYRDGHTAEEFSRSITTDGKLPTEMEMHELLTVVNFRLNPPKPEPDHYRRRHAAYIVVQSVYSRRCQPVHIPHQAA